MKGTLEPKRLRSLTFSCKPAVIEIQPADHGANVESSTDWIQLVVSAKDFSSYANEENKWKVAQDYGRKTLD
jgi:hypothetical protein